MKSGRRQVIRKKNYPAANTKTSKKTVKTMSVDHLTGLYNRQYFNKYLKKFIKVSEREKNPFSLVILDINNFKKVNDTYGRPSSDKILTDLAEILRKSVRRVDVCFRYGGDEIVVILPQTEKIVAENIVKRIKNKVETYKFSVVSGQTLHLSVSIGLIVRPDDGFKPEDFIKKADEFLYKAKRQEKKREKPFILVTKLSPPELKKNVIFRARLISLLKDNLDKKLTLVVADAGYGKTTLLTQLIKDQNLSVVFYDLDKGDNDVMVFLSYLLQGLEQLQSYLVERTRGLLEHGREIAKNYKLIMGTLINELMEKRNEPLHLILDDYHTLITGSVVHEALDYFINNMPNTVKVVIASRTMPQLSSLAKWRSKQNLFELSREELKFTDGEIKDLLSVVYRVMLTEEELDYVSQHTEGWITGIQLILLTAGKDRKTVKETLNGYVAANQPLFEYFANEILTGESPRIQDFLIYSSILEIMTPDVCNTVLGIKDSVRLLRDLERRNLFVTAVGNEEYKYHHLFQEFLRERIVDIRSKKVLNLKAARYFIQSGQREQAIEHFLAAKSYKWAGKLIAQVSRQMKNQAHFATLDTWLKQIPEDITRQQPRLLVTQGVLYHVQGHIHKAEDMYAQAEHLLQDKGDMSYFAYALMEHGILLWTKASYQDSLKIHLKALKICPGSEVKLRADLFNNLGLVSRALGHFKKARSYLLKAYQGARHAKDYSHLLTIGNNLAYLSFSQGDMRRAFKSFEPIIEKIGDDYGLEYGVIFANAAKSAIALGKIKWAEHCLDLGWTLCRPYEDPWSKAALYQGFGALYIQKTQWDVAEQYLNKALNEFKKLQWAEQEIAIFRDIARLYRYQDDYAVAEEYLKRMQECVDTTESPIGIFLLREIGLLYVSRGQIDKAQKAVRTSLRLAQKFRRKVGEFLACLASATVALAAAKESDAVRFLRRACRLAKIKGYNGILVRELRHNLKLTELAQRNAIEKNYLLSLNLPKEKPKLQIKVRCFGGLGLCDMKGTALPLTWPTEKTRSLFAFLIAHREIPIHRDVIVERLWPGLEKKRASINFRTTATRMRQSLAKTLSGKLAQNKIFIRQHGKYQLFPDIQLHVETEEYNLLLKQAERTGSDQEKAKLIYQALDLYTGDYLPEVYDSWSDALRRDFLECRLRALHWLAKYLAANNDDSGCISACETYLSVDPLSEEITRLCMTSLGRIGRIAVVKTCYTSLKKVLQQELHSSPSKETEDLYRILVGTDTTV